MGNLSDLELVRLNIQLTKRCNQRRISCNSYKSENSNEISFADIAKIVDDICKIENIKNIAFTGGEPTLRNDFLKIASFAASKSPNVSITTNGYLLSDENKLINVLESGVNRFTLSLHGLNGEHDDFTRTKGAENNLLKGLDLLLKYQQDYNLQIKIGYLVNINKLDNLEQMLEFCESKGVVLYPEIIDYSIPVFQNSELALAIPRDKITTYERDNLVSLLSGWLADRRKVLLSENSIKFIHYYYSGMQIKGICPLGLTDVYVDSNGYVYTGCWYMNAIGNIKQKSIFDILNSNEYKENINRMLVRDCMGCTCGYLLQSDYAQFTV